MVQESVRLASDLLTYETQSILFGRTRKTVEIMLNTLRNKTQLSNKEIRGYRGGYLARERREIEADLRSGAVKAVVATNALELGIDIGGMGGAVLAGYPGSVAATLQQAGRAGRNEESAAAVFVASANPLDQFLAHHPEFLVDKQPEHALINPDNLLILLSHLRCAAYELPFRKGENFGNVAASEVEEILNLLVNEGNLHPSAEKYFWVSDVYPAAEISLRGISDSNIVLQAVEQGEKRVIGQIDLFGAHWMVHPEAIYIHEGRSYFVDELDLEEGIARLHPSDADYYTMPQSRSSISLVKEQDSKEVIGASKHFGDLAVSTQVVGYQKREWSGNRIPGTGQVDLPPIEIRTSGYWIAIKDETVDHLRSQGLWSNDQNNYGPNWKSQKERTRERDEFTCQICGAVEHERAHDVHHKIPFRNFANYQQANLLENLITLCPSCHRRAESAVRMRSGLSGLAFTLRHLAPLFLMCDVGDIGVEAEAQSELAQGRPALIVFDHAQDAMGFSKRLFEIHDELITQAKRLVTACECKDGCPSCVGPGGEMGQGSKAESLALLKALTGAVKLA